MIPISQPRRLHHERQRLTQQLDPQRDPGQWFQRHARRGRSRFGLPSGPLASSLHRRRDDPDRVRYSGHSTKAVIRLSTNDKSSIDALFKNVGKATLEGDDYTIVVADDFMPAYDGDESDATPHEVTVRNAPPAPPAPATETSEETIDGIKIKTEKTTNPDGTVTMIRKIDPVTSARVEDTDTENGDKADIPLQFGNPDATMSQTRASLPLGIGVIVEGESIPKPITMDENGSPVHDLLNLTDTTVSSEDTTKDAMMSAGRSFLAGLQDGGASLVVNSVVFTTSEDFDANDEILISGSAPENNMGVSEALVIDLTQLPSGSKLRLEDIEYAVITGEATITGGRGENTVIGDDQRQYIVLGEGDDRLYGGGGDDVIGSEGGNDLLFGNAGNDTMFGGAGADQIHGGADVDVVTYEGNRSDYLIEQIDSVVTVTLIADPADVDTLINVESIQFKDETLGVSYGNELSVLATLYRQVLDRQADLGGIQFWAAGEESSTVSAATAYNMLGKEEVVAKYGVDITNLGNGVTNEQAVNFLYEAVLDRVADSDGLSYWTGLLDDGADIQNIAAAFVASAEFTSSMMIRTDWEFIV